MTSRNRLRRQLRDIQFRHAYADEHLNLSISTQIKVIREAQGLSQTKLAEKIGTKQAGISRIESANYNRWSVAVLKRLAEAFDLRLRISFEEFGTLWGDVENFSRASLQRREFKDDPVFNEPSIGINVGHAAAWMAALRPGVERAAGVATATIPRALGCKRDWQSYVGQRVPSVPPGAARAASLGKCA